MKNSGKGFFIIGLICVCSIISMFKEPKCAWGDCNRKPIEGERYCYLHDYDFGSYKSSYKSNYSGGYNSSSSKTYSNDSSYSGNSYSTYKSYGSSYDSYDAGYEDVYENDDYDWDRYCSDDDYAAGVDDAMDELDW